MVVVQYGGGGIMIDPMLLPCQSLASRQEGNLQARDHIAVSSQAMEALFTRKD